MSEASQQGMDYEEIMEHLLQNENYPKLMNTQGFELFPLAEQIPQSLNYNLQSNSRVVRKIEGAGGLSQTLLRGFYFQLLKLCFQLFDEESQKNYLEITKSILFDKALLQKEEMRIHMKHLAEFFSIMENEEAEEYPSFQEILLQHSEIDQAFLAILAFILTSESQVEQKQQLVEAMLNQLCQFFQETLIANHPFYQFQESEVYILVDNSTNVFLVYNEDQQEELSHISHSDQSSNPKGISSISSQVKKDENNNYESFSNRFQDEPVKQSPITQKEVKLEIGERPGSNQSAKSGYFAKIQENPYKPQSQKESDYSYNNFKKGSQRVSNPYDISVPPNPPTSISLEDKIHHYSSPTRDIYKPQQKFNESNVAHNSSNYYDGLYGEIPHNSSVHLNNSRTDTTIINMFGDMIKSGKFQNSVTEEYMRPKKSIESTQKILESQEEFQHQNSSDNYPTFAKKLNKADEASILKRAKSVNSVNEHLSDANSVSIVASKTIDYSFPQKQSFGGPFYSQSENRNFIGLTLEKTQSLVKQASFNNQKMFQNNEPQQIVNFDDEDSIFYKPKRSQLRVINEVTASKETITQRNSQKFDDSKGSIYRQFSDTKILKLLKEPFKTKVQLMRNRFKGQHFNL